MVKRTLWTRAIKLLDKPDEMLTRGFFDDDQIYDVYRYLPPELQVVLIYATLPNEILNLRCNFTDPIRILVKCDELTLEWQKKILAVTEMEEWKSDTLCELYDTRSNTQAVIFCSTKQKRHASEGARCHNGKVQGNKRFGLGSYHDQYVDSSA